jgi:uncharacterized membrane protein (DUF106 family)
MFFVSLDFTFIVLVFCIVTSVLSVYENKTEVTTQKTKTMKVESRDTENIRDKTQSKDKQNRSYNTEN